MVKLAIAGRRSNIRSRKGSGNPKGRPKRKASDRAAIFRRIANETITVPGANGAMRLPRWEALLRQLMSLGMGDKPQLLPLLLEMRDDFPYGSDNPELVLTENQMKY